MKKIGVVIGDEAHTILINFQKARGFRLLDDALDTILREKGKKKCH